MCNFEIAQLHECFLPLLSQSYTKGPATEATTTITTFITGTDGSTTPGTTVVVETSTQNTISSNLSVSTTEEITITTILTFTNGSATTEAITAIETSSNTPISYSSGTITKDYTVSSTATGDTNADTSTIMETYASISTSDRYGYTTVESNFAAVDTRSKCNNKSGVSAVIDAFPSKTVTSNIRQSASSSIRIYYSNSTSQLPSFYTTSQEVVSPCTLSTSTSMAKSQTAQPQATPTNTPDFPYITQNSPGDNPTTLGGDNNNGSDLGFDSSSDSGNGANSATSANKGYSNNIFFR